MMFQFSTPKQNFGEHISTTLSLTVSQYINNFWTRSVVISSKCDFLGDIVAMKFITIWRLRVTQETNIFKMTKSVMLQTRVCETDPWIQILNRNRNDIDRNLYSTCKLTFKKLLLVLLQYQKNDSYSYLKRLLKYPIFSYLAV